MPTKSNLITELKNEDYVPVVKDSMIYYGGCQMWFPENHWYSKDYVLHNYGCGTIATSDLFLYLALQDEALRTLETGLAIQDHYKIAYENYISYVHLINRHYTKTHRLIAVTGPAAASAINRYASGNKLKYHASWKWKSTYYDMLEQIEEMLSKDIPVVLSIGPNLPNLWGKKGIPFYERCEIDYQDENTKASEVSKPYYYKAVKQNINSHYVTVTGLIKDDVTERIMLRISSWGKKYYINYEEYWDYIENSSAAFTSSIVYVKRAKP